MTERRKSFVAHARAGLFWASIAATIAATLDTVGASGSLAASDLPPLFVFLIALYGLFLFPVGLVGAPLLRVPRSGALHVWLSLCAAATTTTVVGFSAILWTRRLFNNVELGALLAASIATACGAALLVLTKVLYDRTTSQTTQRVTGAGAALVAIVGVVWLSHQNKSGFDQLSPWLLAIPPTLGIWAVAGFLARQRLLRLPNVAWLAPMVVVGAMLGALGMELGGAAPGDHAGAHAPLARMIAPAVHHVSDFDGDGFSSLMGGGDCAPMDAQVAPGKFDVPGDGIDNNCLGGDARPHTADARPVWFDVPKTPLDVVLVTVETLRADHVGFAGYHRKTTPNLDEIAKSAAVFEHFYASSTFTRLSLPSLLTSRSPSRIVWEKQKPSKFPRVAAENPWLPEAFKKAGYSTASFTGDFPAFTNKDSIGFDRGFDTYDATAAIKYKGGTMRGFPSKSQIPKFRKWLDAAKPSRRVFVWIHLFEPHYSYQQFPGAPKFGKERIDKYDSEIWGVDQAIGKLVDHLKATGRWDKTVLVVLGDHGEEFEEHGSKYHGSNLYEPQSRTPLLIRVPGVKPVRVRQPASMVDVAATLLNVANARKGFDTVDGRNLTPALFGERLDERALFTEVWNIKTRGGYQVAVVNWPYKMLASGTGGKKEELFDLAADPNETKNIVKDNVAEAAAMRELLHQYLDSTQLTYR